MPAVRKQYPFDVIEAKWQRHWLENKTFKAGEPACPGAQVPKCPSENPPQALTHSGTQALRHSGTQTPKFYVLDMFPYPSGAGLHVGHPEGYTATDILARYKRMRGFNVLHPMGWDAFGLPAEQYAIDTGTHPAVKTQENINTFRRQIQLLGFSYDWDRELDTTDPEYYRWTQWIFLQLYNKGLAYQAEVPVWWCDGCKAVLANEEVKNDGTCERKGHPNVVRRPLRQWLLRITAYAERLLKDLELVEWPASTKEQQINWIGRSEGATVKFAVHGSQFSVEVFTTRPDTLFGATYMVLAPEHPLVEKITAAEQRLAVEKYRAEAARKSELERTALEKEKTGVFTGSYAINPVNEEKIPIWIADYVMMGYGTGAIMAVPAHDTRDLEFARKFGLAVRVVVNPTDPTDPIGFVGDGVSVNSGLITGLPTPEAKRKITAWLEERGLGKATVNYKLRDWLFSRQRYWGEPIPIVHCAKCGTVPVPESELPLRLPELKDYSPTGNAEPPLAKATDWVNTNCPKCRGAAQRETNTMPQWAGSCWYYLRYIDPKNPAAIVAKEKERYWQPVDLYVGGAEHAVLHLLYSRFWHKVLFDLGHVSTPEPFRKLIHQGMILGEDNAKMSKSRGNVINPDEVVAEYGADAFRLYEMFMGPLEMVKPWSTQGVKGVYGFLGRVWRLFVDEQSDRQYQDEVTAGTRRPEDLSCLKVAGSIQNIAPTAEQLKLLHGTIKKVTQDLDAMAFNVGIAHMMEFVNDTMKLAQAGQPLSKSVLEQFVLVLSPFAPHLAEELWRLLGHASTLAYEPWPAWNETHLVEDTIEIVVQVNGKVRDRVSVPAAADEETVKAQALASEKVKTAMAGKPPKKVIVIPKKLVNVVVG